MTFGFKKLAVAGVALGTLLTLGGCYEDGYGYGGVSAGYGYPSGYGYGDSYDNYGYGYGWYDGFYYPGRGYYIYDRRGHRHQWDDHHRRYWEGRRDHAGTQDGRNHDGNWDGRRRDGRYAGDAFRGSPDRQRMEGQRSWRGREGATVAPQRSAPPMASAPSRAERSSDGRPGDSFRHRRGD
jgi:hypothetical protein